ncbi:MAG: metallophosphatase family protein [Methylobacteriaceae bacterium]|jgi:predicted phosphodiesterase|nr:metallophosphatase family protein [Methylobacteriaceae bacterium]
MRLAVIADIHSNVLALQAVLADIDTRDADMIINLGDMLSGPLYPRETADLLMARNIPGIRGNHERNLLTVPRAKLGKSDGFAHDSLERDHFEWLVLLPESLEPVEGVLAVHGIPGDDSVYFLETVTPDGLRLATDEEIVQRAGAAAQPLILCGHSHLPGIRTFGDGRMIVNPGSVGYPAYDDERPYPYKVETGSPHARYALLEQAGDSWTVLHVAVPYDWESAAEKAWAENRPDWVIALRTGHM